MPPLSTNTMAAMTGDFVSSSSSSFAPAPATRTAEDEEEEEAIPLPLSESPSSPPNQKPLPPINVLGQHFRDSKNTPPPPPPLVEPASSVSERAGERVGSAYPLGLSSDVQQDPNLGDCSPTVELCVNPNDVFGGGGGCATGLAGCHSGPPRDVVFNPGRRRSSTKSLRELLVSRERERQLSLVQSFCILNPRTYTYTQVPTLQDSDDDFMDDFNLDKLL